MTIQGPLNFDSRNAKFYRWFYNVNYMPNGLCPYIWKSLVAYLCIIPWVLFTMPAQLWFGFKSEEWEKKFFLSCFIYFAFLLIYGMCLAMTLPFVTYEKNSFSYTLSLLGVTMWFSLFGGGIITGIVKLWPTKKQKIKQPNLLKEYIKAQYTKACPRITWTKPSTNG